MLQEQNRKLEYQLSSEALKYIIGVERCIKNRQGKGYGSV